jgi:hypothetical protein
MALTVCSLYHVIEVKCTDNISQTLPLPLPLPLFVCYVGIICSGETSQIYSLNC